MLLIHKDLNPVLIKEYNEEFELIVVEVSTHKETIRVMTGYGPQENWNENDRMPFWLAVDEEISAAEIYGRSVIIQMDANAKLGSTYIKGDPNKITGNGNILAGIVNRHAMVVVNGLTKKCTGTITRQRTTKENTEKSVIDYIVVSGDLERHIENMHIDEERINVLTKIVNKRAKGTKGHLDICETDHNTITAKLQIKWNKSNIEKPIEVYKFNDKESLKTFKDLTTNTKQLSNIFETDKPLNVQTKKLLKRIKGFIAESFEKVKITNKSNKELDKLYDKRRLLRAQKGHKARLQLKAVEKELADKYGEQMYAKIKEEIECIDSEDGGFNSGKLWKLKKKLSPTTYDPPTAMKDTNGNLLTSEKDILKEATKHYQKVFEDKPMDPSIKHLKSQREELCMKRLEAARANKSPPWTVDDVKYVLKSLKPKISKDPYEMPNELFILNNAGEDLISALTALMNQIKEQQVFPDCLRLCNVTNAYKNKGDRSSFDSYRGLFRTPVLRNILDKLIYVDLYETIDGSLTDCNVGSRKRRNIRDNLFVVNAIMNEAKEQNEEACDICVYDVKKCHDTLWLHECINDLWEAGVQDDRLALLFLENESAHIAIKTSSGNTERITILKKIMQGTVWAGLMCTTTMDQLGKEVYADPALVYKYRGKVDVPPLQMVDDIISASKCGPTTVAINATINSFIERKKLTFGADKCSRIHISKKAGNSECVPVKVHTADMKNSEKEKYLGDFITKDANSNATLAARKSRAYAILAEIRAFLTEIPLGSRRMEIGLALRDAWFVNGILFNSEVWGSYADKHVQELMVIDNMILRTVIGAQAKVPVEALFLETSSLSIKQIISIRRMLYLKTILGRPDGEVVKKVYLAMKENPLRGDWYHRIVADFQQASIDLDERVIINTDWPKFKILVKTSVWKRFFQELQEKKEMHIKVKHIDYSGLRKPQPYLLSHKFDNDMSSMLFNLRCSSINDFKDNFHTLYGNLPPCKMLCGKGIDSQRHALSCKAILEKLSLPELETMNQLRYSHLYGSISEQENITMMFSRILQIRAADKSTATGLPGHNNSGPG